MTVTSEGLLLISKIKIGQDEGVLSHTQPPLVIVCHAI